MLVDDKDPPWFTNKIKNLITEKNPRVLKHFHENSKNLQILNKLGSLQNLLSKSIAESKRNYYYRMADKLHNTEKGSNAYWSLLKRFLNNKKIPLIPPIFHGNEFVTNLKKLFNSFFSKQCFLISSELPTNFTYITEKRLDNVIFSIGDVDNVIQNLDPNKTKIRLVFEC